MLAHWYNVAVCMALAVGQSGVRPWESLLPVVDEGGPLDEEGAQRMLRAGFEQMGQAPEGWATHKRLILLDPSASGRDKDEALAALTGLVDAVFSLYVMVKLRDALEREGVRRDSEEFLYLLGTRIEKQRHGTKGSPRQTASATATSTSQPKG